jgi:lysozyme
MNEEAAQITQSICEPSEGFRSKPYYCPARVPTIGFGTTVYPDGRRVALTDPPVTKVAARVFLRDQIRKVYQPGTQALVPGMATPVLGAITDFSYNLGLTRLKGSTLRRRLLAGDLEGAITELRKWTRGGGRVLPGLVVRREREASIIREWVQSVEVGGGE